MSYIYGFEKLKVWQFARAFVKDIYVLSNKFSSTEKYGLVSQIQRAAVSVSSNIAEGTSRTSLKEQLHFVEIAYGSLMETYSQICLAFDLEYIFAEDYIKNQIDNIAAQLSQLRKSLIDRINQLKDNESSK